LRPVGGAAECRRQHQTRSEVHAARRLRRLSRLRAPAGKQWRFGFYPNRGGDYRDEATLTRGVSESPMSVAHWAAAKNITKTHPSPTSPLSSGSLNEQPTNNHRLQTDGGKPMKHQNLSVAVLLAAGMAMALPGKYLLGSTASAQTPRA